MTRVRHEKGAWLHGMRIIFYKNIVTPNIMTRKFRNRRIKGKEGTRAFNVIPFILCESVVPRDLKRPPEVSFEFFLRTTLTMRAFCLRYYLLLLES